MMDDDFDQYFEEEEEAEDSSDPCLIKPIAWNPSESYSQETSNKTEYYNYCNNYCGLQSFSRQQPPQKAIPVDIDKSYDELVGKSSFAGYQQQEQKYSNHGHQRSLAYQSSLGFN